MSKRIATDLPRFSGASQPRVRLTQDRSEIVGFLETQRAYAATVFGYLDPPFFALTKWHVAEAPEVCALVLEMNGSAGTSLYVQGETAGLDAILNQLLPQRHAYLCFQPQHQELVQRYFILRDPLFLVRMHSDAEAFRPVPSRAELLSPNCLSQVNDLYRTDSGALVARQQLAEGAYYGIWEDAKLVSIAGTQVLSEPHKASVIANVLTHRQYRGRGYATQCVSSLTAHLLDRVQDVVLNVDPQNFPAVRLYRRLGFKENSRLVEAWTFWKGHSLLDRAFALVYDWFTR